MKLDERLRDTLHRRAAAVDPSSDGWIAITRRIERHRRRAQTVRVSLVAGLSVAAVAVAVAVVTLPGPDTGRQDVATGGSDRSLGPTTTYSPFAEAPIDGRETTGPPPLGTTPGPGGGLGETGSSGPTTVPGPAGMAATTPDHRLTPVWPETRAEIDRLQTAVAEGHQPWWNDPAAVAAAYLDDRGLSSPEVTEPSTIGDSGALRYSAGGLGGWVSLSRLSDGSVYYVDGSRSDRILEVRLARHGDSLAVKVLATPPAS